MDSQPSNQPDSQQPENGQTEQSEQPKGGQPKDRSKWWIALIGSGLALSPIHNSAFTNALTNSKGETLFFLPAFAYLMLLMGSWMFLLWNWERVKETGWGDRKVTVPLFIIAGALALSGIGIDGGIGAKFAPLGMGAALVSLYLSARILGRDLFLPLAVGAAVASGGILLYQLLYFSGPTGGFIFEDNYDIATGYILLGAALLVGRRSWQQGLSFLALLALFLSGSAEAVFAVGVVGIVMLFRRDWSRRAVVLLALFAVVAVAVFASGYGGELHRLTIGSVTGDTEQAARGGQSVLAERWDGIADAMANLKPLGEGYIITGFQQVDMVHNVPLVIVQQLGWAGVLAAGAWLWVSLWCLVKTRWKYVWVLVLALSVWDHFTWTQLAPLFPMVVGASLVDTVDSDLVFR